MQIVVDPELKPEDAAAIRTGLHAYNDSRVDSPDGHLGILLKDDSGQTVGGQLVGKALWATALPVLAFLVVRQVRHAVHRDAIGA